MNTTPASYQPQDIDDATTTFPVRVQHLMPPVPADFPTHGPWVEWQRDWFFKGLKQRPTPKAGIDLNKAMRHLAAIQGSFEPKHEVKEATVAYLASLWFEKP